MEPLTRRETLDILSCMGVELPRTTRLPDDVLDKRLRDALNHAQHRSGLPPSSLDPRRLPRWPTGESLLKVLRRVDLGEALAIEDAERAGKAYERELFQDVFWDLGQTMMAIGQALDHGRTWCVVQDPKGETGAILLRFLCVLCVDGNTPGVVLTYRAINRETGAEGAEWISFQGAHDSAEKRLPQEVVGVSEIKASVLELKLILKLLAMNAPLLRPTEQRRRLALCGKKQTSRCSQCQSVSYCGAECQKADWPAHKQTCRSLKGGRWVTVPFRMSFPDEPNNTWLSRRSECNSILDESMYTLRKALGAESGPPPNIHGEKTFLVKLQAPHGIPQQAFMIYDRRKSFRSVFFWREDAASVYDDCIAEITGPRIAFGGRKMYRWAKRTGDFELSVCLDREPNTDIRW